MVDILTEFRQQQQIPRADILTESRQRRQAQPAPAPSGLQQQPVDTVDPIVRQQREQMRTGGFIELSPQQKTEAAQAAAAGSADESLLGRIKSNPFSVGMGRGAGDLIEGAEQLGRQGLEKAGVMTADQNQARDAEVRQGREQFTRGFGDEALSAAGLGRIAGETAPLLIPGMALGRIPTAAGRIGLGAAEGAVAGGLQFVDPNSDQTRLGNMAQGAALGTAGAGLIEGISKGVGRAINTVQGRLRPEAQEALDLGQGFGVDVFASDASQSPNLQKTAVLAESIPAVGLTGPRLAQNRQAGAAAEQVRGQLAPQIDDVGREIQASLSRQSTRLQDIARTQYDKVSQAADPLGAVPLAETRKAAQRLLDEARSDIDPSSGLISRLETILNAPDANNFSTARRFRSNLGDSIRQLEQQVDLKAARPLQQIKAALEQDLGNFANQAGGDVATTWKRADTFFKNRVVPQRERDIVRAINTSEPDRIFSQFIKSGNRDRAQRLYNALDAKGKGAVRAGILDQAMTAGNTVNSAGGIAFSPAKFAQQIEKLSDAVGVNFRGNDKKLLEGFTKLMRHVQRSGQVAENPPTGNRLVLPAILIDPFVSGGVGLASTAATGLALRGLMTTAAGKRLLLAANDYGPGSKPVELALRALQRGTPTATGTQADNF